MILLSLFPFLCVCFIVQRYFVICFLIRVFSSSSKKSQQLLSLLSLLVFKKISLPLNTLHCTERTKRDLYDLPAPTTISFDRALFNCTSGAERTDGYCSKKREVEDPRETHIKFLTQGKQTFSNNNNNNDNKKKNVVKLFHNFINNYSQMHVLILCIFG